MAIMSKKKVTVIFMYEKLKCNTSVFIQYCRIQLSRVRYLSVLNDEKIMSTKFYQFKFKSNALYSISEQNHFFK